MGLASQSVVSVTGKGAGIINANLISWQIVDAAGYRSDQLTLTVAAPDLDSLPASGESLSFSWGMVVDGVENMINKGSFTITRVTPKLWPHQVTIVATAAQFQVNDQSEFKLRRSQSWHNTTLGAVFRELVDRHNLSPRIAPDLDQIAIAHIDQNDETDMSFLTRIARQYDAVAKPIDKLYVMARRGQLKSLSGQSLSPVVISLPKDNQPMSSSFINAEFDNPERRKFGGCSAVWVNADGDEQKVEVGVKPFKRLTQRFTNDTEARQRCDAEMRKISRTGSTIRLNLPANPLLAAEGLIMLDDSFPAYMMGTWSIDKVTSNGSVSSGARTSIQATQPKS